MIENHPFRPHDFLTQHDRRTARKHQRFCGSYLPRCGNLVKTCPVQKPWNMNSIATWVGASATMVLAGGYPQEIKAEAFTGAAFLQWSQADQMGYISAQVGMAASIAARIKPDMAQCISDTFYSDDDISELGFETATKRITEFET